MLNGDQLIVRITLFYRETLTGHFMVDGLADKIGLLPCWAGILRSYPRLVLRLALIQHLEQAHHDGHGGDSRGKPVLVKPIHDGAEMALPPVFPA